jgi:hypothetical protein
MSNKKQSSVEWLVEQLRKNEFIDDPTELIEQAKAMHRKQIEDAYGHGQNNGYMYAHQKAITISKENYFNQTFGGNNE